AVAGRLWPGWLAGIGRNAAVAGRRLASGGRNDPGRRPAGPLSASRSITTLARPWVSVSWMLGEGLARLTAQLGEQTGVAAQMVVTGDAGALPPQVEATLLRVAQEALANVRRHALAREVTVTLSYMGDQVALDVQDDGQGFAP